MGRTLPSLKYAWVKMYICVRACVHVCVHVGVCASSTITALGINNWYEDTDDYYYIILCSQY
jgi:hypothetical protein